MKTVADARYASVSEAKSLLPKLLKQGLPVVLLRHNEPVAALVSIDNYNEFRALQALVRRPALFDRLRSQADRARATPIATLRTLGDLDRLFEVHRKEEQAVDNPGTATSG